MEITINIGGRIVSVEVSAEVAECLDAGEHKAENLYHEKRRHWDEREFDEYIIATEGLLPYSASPEEQVCQWETWDEIMAVHWPCVLIPSVSGFCSMRCTILITPKSAGCAVVPGNRFVKALWLCAKSFSNFSVKLPDKCPFNWPIK